MEKTVCFCSEDLQDSTVSRIARLQPILDIPESTWLKTHSFCPMRLHRVLFGSKEHSNFHLPGYRATTAVLGRATEEKHCIFFGRIISLISVQKFLLLWLHFHCRRSLWMERGSCIKVWTIAQDFKASIQAVTCSYSSEGSAAAWHRKELVSYRLKQAVVAPLYGVGGW